MFASQLAGKGRKLRAALMSKYGVVSDVEMPSLESISLISNADYQKIGINFNGEDFQCSQAAGGVFFYEHGSGRKILLKLSI